MKVNSISRITCYVEDLSRTAEFYEAIGSRDAAWLSGGGGI